MGTRFRCSRTTHAQSTSSDSIKIDVPAGRYLLIHSIEVTGMSSAAGVGAEIGFFRVTTTGSSYATAVTLKNVDPNGASAPSGFSAGYGSTTQPTLEADPLWRGDFQPLGGKARFTEIAGPLTCWSSAAYQVAIRGIVGTPNIAIDEVDMEIL